MKFAYLILAHKNPHQLSDLINTLEDGDNYFFIHIDDKIELMPFISENYTALNHLLFCQKRVKVSWGGFSQIEATMLLIDLLMETGIKPDYVHLMSGQDFPLKSNQEINFFFEKQHGKNFINYFPMPYQNWAGNGGMDRITYKWLIDEAGYERASYLVQIQKERGMHRSFPKDFNPYGGSQWWSLTGKCVEFIAQKCISGNILFDFYRNTFIPDEMLFQTILLNSHFKNSICNNNLRFIDWKKGPEYPRILRLDDLQLLLSSKSLYARKFDDSIDVKIRNVLKTYINP